MKLLKQSQAAERIGLSRQRVSKLIQDGLLKTDPSSGLVSTAEIRRFKRLKRSPGRPKNGKPAKKK